MGAEFDRIRWEAAVREGPGTVGWGLVLTSIPLALSWWLGSWIALGLGVFMFLRVLMDASVWRSAHKALRRGGKAPRGPRPPAEATWDDPDLGRLQWSPDDHWDLFIEVDGDEVAVSLSGAREKGPDPESKALWNDLRSRVPQVWSDVVAFAQSWAAASELSLAREEFRLAGITVRGKDPDDEAVTFHPEIATDANGTYTVTIRDWKPVDLHRDS